MSSALKGKRIVNTRALHQAGELDKLLLERGAVPVSYPCIKIVPPADTTVLDKAVHDLLGGEFDWLILTSVNTVSMLAERIHTSGYPFNKPSFKTAAIGAATADAVVKQLGFSIDILPEEYVGESLAEALHVSAGTRVLLPQSALAQSTIADLLKHKRAFVKVITAYDTVVGSGGVELATLLHVQKIDAVIFTSSSTVINFIKRIEQEAVQVSELNNVCIACIGCKTAATACELDMHVASIAQLHTLNGVLDSLESYFEELTGVSDG